MIEIKKDRQLHQLIITHIGPALDSGQYGIRYVLLKPRTGDGLFPGDAVYDAYGTAGERVTVYAPHDRKNQELQKVLEEETAKYIGAGGEKRPFCFLKVDIVSHSKISRENPQKETDATWDAFEEFIDTNVNKEKGEIWVWQGDGGLCAFSGDDTEERAVRCAQNILTELGGFNEKKNQIEGVKEIQVRLAVHTGWAVPKARKGMIHSQDINFVAHLEAQRTSSNSISISQETYFQLPKNLQSEFNKVSEGFEEHIIYSSADLAVLEDYIRTRSAKLEELETEVVRLQEENEVLRKSGGAKDDTQALQMLLSEIKGNLTIIKQPKSATSRLRDSMWNTHQADVVPLNDIYDPLLEIYAEVSQINTFSEAWAGATSGNRIASLEQALKERKGSLLPNLEEIEGRIEDLLQPPED